MEMSSQSLPNISVLSPVALVPRTPDRQTWQSLQPIPWGRMPFTCPVARSLLSPLLPPARSTVPGGVCPGNDRAPPLSPLASPVARRAVRTWTAAPAVRLQPGPSKEAVDALQRRQAAPRLLPPALGQEGLTLHRAPADNVLRHLNHQRRETVPLLKVKTGVPRTPAPLVSSKPS